VNTDADAIVIKYCRYTYINENTALVADYTGYILKEYTLNKE